MTQDGLWLQKCQDITTWMETNGRNPSRHHVEEHLMVNWLKHNRKLLNAGLLKPERAERLKELLVLREQFRRVNQYE